MLKERPMSNGIIYLGPGGFRAMLDAEAQARLHISGDEFLRRRRAGALPDTMIVSELSVLAGMVEEKGQRGD